MRHEVDGVMVPFASPRLLWRMKAVTRGVCADLLEHCVREHVVITSIRPRLAA